MARPTKTPDDKRTERLPYARLTVAERALVDGMAARAGLTPSEFCRRASLGQKVTAKPDPAPAAQGGGADYLPELGRIGSNLNQLARRANASGIIPPQLADTLDMLNALTRRIEREVLG